MMFPKSLLSGRSLLHGIAYIVCERSVRRTSAKRTSRTAVNCLSWCDLIAHHEETSLEHLERDVGRRRGAC
jgi:hypothetical protein